MKKKIIVIENELNEGRNLVKTVKDRYDVEAVLLGDKPDISKDDFQDNYESYEKVKSYLDDLIEKKKLDEEIGLLLDVFLSTDEKDTLDKGDQSKYKAEIAKQIVSQYSKNYNIFIVTTYDDFFYFAERLLGNKEFEDKYVIKEDFLDGHKPSVEKIRMSLLNM